MRTDPSLADPLAFLASPSNNPAGNLLHIVCPDPHSNLHIFAQAVSYSWKASPQSSPCPPNLHSPSSFSQSENVTSSLKYSPMLSPEWAHGLDTYSSYVAPNPGFTQRSCVFTPIFHNVWKWGTYFYICAHIEPWMIYSILFFGTFFYIFLYDYNNAHIPVNSILFLTPVGNMPFINSFVFLVNNYCTLGRSSSTTLHNSWKIKYTFTLKDFTVS